MKLLNPAVPPKTVPNGRLQAVILDWAGTAVDHGSLAPARTLQQVFERCDIVLSDAEVRRDMGLPKKDHIRAIMKLPGLCDAWRKLYGRAPTEADVEKIYREFIPLQFSCLAEYSPLIPGVVDAVENFRRRGLKIGSTTGYTRAMLDVLVERSACAGYRPDCSLAPEDVGAGRPHPFMIYENAVRLRVYPMAALVKVGDTPADIHEALNAGAWAIGVAGTGNRIGLSYRDFQALTISEQRERLADARVELERAGAHYVVDSLAEVGAVLDAIERRP